MLRQSAGIFHLEHIANEEVQRCMRVEPITEKLQSSAYNGMATWCPDTVTKFVYTLQVAGKCPQVRLKQR